MTVAATPDVMLARLRPDRPGPTCQHVVPASARNVPPVVAAYCRTVLRAIDLDPRYVDRLAGSPCLPCLRCAPSEVVMHLARVSGRLYPAEPVGEGTRPEPVGPFVYASGLAALQVRHIVPDDVHRWPHNGRLVVSVECGHMAWCPVAGPWPSASWPVCAECLNAIRRRAAPKTARPGISSTP